MDLNTSLAYIGVAVGAAGFVLAVIDLLAGRAGENRIVARIDALNAKTSRPAANADDSTTVSLTLATALERMAIIVDKLT